MSKKKHKDTTNETNTATESKYANKAVADIYSTTTLNIRKKGSINAKIVGKMKKGNIATVLKKGSEWSKVRSGNVTGYVKNQYLVFGDEIENFAKQNVKKVAKVQTETLRVRKKASTDSKIVTLVSEDDKLKVKKQTNDWAKVKVDGQTGYVSKDYAKVTYSFGKAKSMKQIQAEQEAKNRLNVEEVTLNHILAAQSYGKTHFYNRQRRRFLLQNMSGDSDLKEVYTTYMKMFPLKSRIKKQLKAIVKCCPKSVYFPIKKLIHSI